MELKPASSIGQKTLLMSEIDPIVKEVNLTPLTPLTLTILMNLLTVQKRYVKIVLTVILYPDIMRVLLIMLEIGIIMLIAVLI